MLLAAVVVHHNYELVDRSPVAIKDILACKSPFTVIHNRSSGSAQSRIDRHVFLCYKTPEAWPAKVEGSDSDPLPKLLSSAFKAHKNDISIKTKLTVCEGREGTEFEDGDVLIFPDMIKYS